MYNHIGVKFKTIEEKNKMLDFLNKSVGILGVLESTDISQPTFQFKFVTGDEISQNYVKEECDKYIVFERYFVGLAALKLFTWMAVKSSERNENGNPYIIENGKKVEILSASKNEESLSYYVVDDDGLYYQHFSGKEKLFLLAKGEYMLMIEQNKIMEELNMSYLKNLG